MNLEFKLGHFARTHRSSLFAFLLIVEMVISPAADYHPHVGAILAALIWLSIIAALYYLADRRLVRSLILPVAGLWAIARLLEAFAEPTHFYAHLAPFMGLLLSCSLLWGIGERAHRVEREPSTAIAEAIIAYLLIATAFAQVYWIFDKLLLKPFNQPIPPHDISTLLYFSLVTISSVGYGVIAPINPYVRMVAAFEAIIGIFYIAVVVARLVSTYSVSQREAQK